MVVSLRALNRKNGAAATRPMGGEVATIAPVNGSTMSPPDILVSTEGSFFPLNKPKVINGDIQLPHGPHPSLCLGLCYGADAVNPWR